MSDEQKQNQQPQWEWDSFKRRPRHGGRDMSRAAQTRWIVVMLLFMGLIALGFYLKSANEDPRYPGCTGFFGTEDSSCEAAIAADRLSGGPIGVIDRP